MRLHEHWRLVRNQLLTGEWVCHSRRGVSSWWLVQWQCDVIVAVHLRQRVSSTLIVTSGSWWNVTTFIYVTVDDVIGFVDTGVIRVKTTTFATRWIPAWTELAITCRMTRIRATAMTATRTWTAVRHCSVFYRTSPVATAVNASRTKVWEQIMLTSS